MKKRKSDANLEVINSELNNLKLIHNTSIKYYTGSKWKTKHNGDITIKGLIEKKTGKLIFLVEFEDGVLVKADNSNILNQNVKNHYDYSNVFGVGCTGRANSKHFLYARWQQMIYRCYNLNHIKYKIYGARGIQVSKELLCFEYYLKYIKTLEYYDLLKKHKDKYDIDRTNNNLNYEVGNLRIVTKSQNSRNTRNKTFVQVTFPDGSTDEGSIVELCEKYNFQASLISKCVCGNRKHHFNCTFQNI